MTTSLRLVYMGTPDFAVGALHALLASRHTVAAVWTQPPRPAGRGHRLTPSPVHQAATIAGVPVHHPENFRDPAAREAFLATGADLAVVAAYGLILPQAILSGPRLGCLNIHASLLPRWRGAAPIQRAILAGDAETGVTIMQMVRQLDAGAMLLKGRVAITADTTGPGLHDALAALGAALIVPAIDGVADGSLTPEPQDETFVTYAAKLTREDGMVDWYRSATIIDAQVRALTPWPGCQFHNGGEAIKILAARAEPPPAGPLATPGTLLDADGLVACGSGALRLLTVQRPNRGPTEAAAFLRGSAWSVGAAT